MIQSKVLPVGLQPAMCATFSPGPTRCEWHSGVCLVHTACRLDLVCTLCRVYRAGPGHTPRGTCVRWLCLLALVCGAGLWAWSCPWIGLTSLNWPAGLSLILWCRPLILLSSKFHSSPCSIAKNWCRYHCKVSWGNESTCQQHLWCSCPSTGVLFQINNSLIINWFLDSGSGLKSITKLSSTFTSVACQCIPLPPVVFLSPRAVHMAAIPHVLQVAHRDCCHGCQSCWVGAAAEPRGWTPLLHTSHFDCCQIWGLRSSLATTVSSWGKVGARGTPWVLEPHQCSSHSSCTEQPPPWFCPACKKYHGLDPACGAKWAGCPCSNFWFLVYFGSGAKNNFGAWTPRKPSSGTTMNCSTEIEHFF